MDLTVYSSVGTQTPTEDRSFEFPECFSPSPQLSRSSVSSSSIGTQTSVRQRSSFESPETCSALPTGHRPRLFRRHSTGSDVYNFSSSPTLLTAYGGLSFLQRGLFKQRMIKEDPIRNTRFGSSTTSCEDSNEDLESVGQELRKIADDLDREVGVRSRSLSVSRFFVNVRRRTSSSSS